MLVIGAGVAIKPPTVETDFGAFMKTDVNTSTLRDGFGFAMSKRREGRRLLEGSVLFKLFTVAIVYDLGEGVAGPRGLFDIEILSEIARFEQSLRDLPGWQELCAQADPIDKPLCDPGISFVHYALPSLKTNAGSIVPTSLRFDGHGRDPVLLETSLLLTEELQVSELLLPTGFAAGDRATTQLRSVFRFKLRCCTSLDPMAVQKQTVRAMAAKWRTLAVGVLLPVLQKASKGIALKVAGNKVKAPLRVYYDGDSLETAEIMEALAGDQRLAGGSGAFVLLYMLLHTRSLLLSVLGLLTIFLAVPLSYVILAVTTGTQTMSIASFLSLFLIVGLGSDVIFVYTDFWKESRQVADHQVDRLVWTLWHAGKASFATTATTAVSFFANLASVLKPLREFGFFMGLCVTLVWVLVTLIFVPLCLVDERCNCCCRRSSGSEGPSMTATLFGELTHRLHRWRRTAVLLTAALSAIAVATSAASATLDTGVPNIFPEEHNQNRGKQVMSGFASLKQIFDALFVAPLDAVDVCGEHELMGRLGCSLYWCEVNPQVPVPQEDMCECFRKHRNATCGWAEEAPVVQRFVGTGALPDDDLQGPIGDFFVSNADDGLSFPAGGDRLGSITRSKVAGPVVLQEWEMGDVMLTEMTQVGASLVREESHASCGWEGVCFCGCYVCKMPNEWVPNGQVRLGQGRRLSAASPQWQVRSNLRASVEVAFGLVVTGQSPLLGEVDLESSWGFNERHEVRQPWAQRNLYSFCMKLPEELRVTEAKCWIDSFRRYVTTKGMRFPVLPSQFDSEAMTFAQTQLVGLHTAGEFLWIREGKVKASYMTFTVDLHKYAATELAMEHKARWDAYLDSYNANASHFAGDAWHTASLWVRAEAQSELIASTVVTLVLVIVLAFLGMAVFTRDCVLSSFVVLATCGVVSGLFFFITVLMGWPIGPIEVIALIVFIGYAVTYSLHVAHRYGSKDALEGELPAELCKELSPAAAVRYQRALFALQTIGGAALGSAVTTAGCSLFLVFCTLTVFQKLGGVVLAVTVMSIAMALSSLPALLLLAGPQHPGRRCLPRGEDLYGCLGWARVAAREFSRLLQQRRAPTAPREEPSGTCDAECGASPAAGEAPPGGPGAAGAAGASGGGGGGGPQPDARGCMLPVASSWPMGSAGVVPGDACAQQPRAPGSSPQEASHTAGGAPLEAPHPPGASVAPLAGAGAASERRRRISEMEFDIGMESPLACIWARETSGMSCSVEGSRRSGIGSL